MKGFNPADMAKFSGLVTLALSLVKPIFQSIEKPSPTYQFGSL
jgi:hypothetical protein